MLKRLVMVILCALLFGDIVVVDYSVAEVFEPADVIVIQSEAFMDVTKISELHFSKDPLPHYKEWLKQSQFGLLKVPVNGGLTCNSEFEFLTGIRHNAISYIPFKDTIAKQDEKINSLAWLLKENQYKTIGIHPYDKEYFNRNVVYPRMGIDQFISMENFSNPTRYGSWITDKDSFNMILKVLKKEVDKKKFIFNVTVQNHAPFCSKGPESKFVKVTSKSFVNEEERLSMQNYVTGLWYTDDALNRFLTEISKRKKRTIVVFYGDHQPPKYHKSFKNMNFFNENGYYTTHYFIYDNKNLITQQEKNISLTQMRFEIESLLEINGETPLKTYEQTMGYDSYDKFVLKDMRALYAEENGKLSR